MTEPTLLSAKMVGLREGSKAAQPPMPIKTETASPPYSGMPRNSPSGGGLYWVSSPRETGYGNAIE